MMEELNQLIRDHAREFQQQLYVYPVVSRRSKGMSIGVNLNPTGICNFKCVYCQVEGDLRIASEKQCHAEYSGEKTPEINLALLETELRRTIKTVLSGELFQTPQFSKTPPDKRRLNDVAFSGDGEPTLAPAFREAMQIVVRVCNEFTESNAKIVLITNATTLHRPEVRDAIDLMMQHRGEIWAKLDAGTEAYYHLIDRSHVPFTTVLDNLTKTSKCYPLVIQTLFLQLQGEPTPESEVKAYIERLREITAVGGQISLVQLYTIARNTAESWVTPLTNAQIDMIAQRVQRETQLNTEVYYANF